MGEKKDRLEKLRRLDSLRRIEADVAAGSSRGLAEVKEEGRLIVCEREDRLVEQGESVPAPVEEPEAKPKKRKRWRRRKSAVEESAASWVPSGPEPTAYSAAGRSLDPADALPDYELRRDDDTTYTVSRDDRDVGPYARRP